MYDPTSGRLVLLTHDSNRNGIVEAWIDMDGRRLLASRGDRDEDGRIDRWEYYDASGRLIKVGFSRKDDGRADGWAFARPDGILERLELSSAADEARIDRREYYQADTSHLASALVRAEEDTNQDGRPDCWETYQAGALATVAWDLDRDGIPDRRFTYRDSTPVSIETEPDGRGGFRRRVELR
jgi:hypothetical protein